MTTLTSLRSAPASVEQNGFLGLPRRTRQIYDLLSGVYPLSTLLFHEKAHKVALSLAGIDDGMRVLEVATGTNQANEYDAFVGAAHTADDGFLSSTRVTKP